MSNIRKVLAVLEMAKANPSEEISIVTLNAEKAFDNVSFHWLRLVLSQFGFPCPFLHLIHTMYSVSSANMITVGLISNNIHLHKGTRQGCTLSPLLFNLAIEPLSWFLHFHAKLHGGKIESQELRTTLFADDIFIFTSNPRADMLHIQEIFTTFWACSGLRINFYKSQMPPLFQAQPPPPLGVRFNFHDCQKSHYTSGDKNRESTLLSLPTQFSPSLENITAELECF